MMQRDHTSRAGKGEHAAEEAAKAKGWTVHLESVRTPIRKQYTGQFCVQYFCAKHKNKVGTVEVLKKSKSRGTVHKEA
jgi:hypothetical protein